MNQYKSNVEAQAKHASTIDWNNMWVGRKVRRKKAGGNEEEKVPLFIL